MPKAAKKKTAAAKKSKVALSNRRLQQPKYRAFRLSKRLRQPKPPLKGAIKLLIISIKTLVKRWWLFGGIVFIYLILTVVLVKGFGISSHIDSLKSSFLALFHGRTSQLFTGLGLYAVLLSSANSSAGDAAGAYQSMLLVVTSLVLIWALRQSLAKEKVKITIRDAFYKGLYPLVPFVLILLVIGLELIPLLISRYLYGIAFSGLAATAIEKVLWGILLFLLVLLSLYMVTSSIFALYIVTLADVRPMQALRSARELVRHRRFMIMRKVLFLPVALLVLSAIIVVPVILVAPRVAEWLFFVLSMLVLAVVHS